MSLQIPIGEQYNKEIGFDYNLGIKVGPRK